MNQERNSDTWKGVIKFIWSKKELLSFIGGLLGGVIGVYFWYEAKITNAAREAVRSEKFLAELSKQIRPICVFTSREIVEADLGAEDYIDTKHISVTPNWSDWGFTISLRAKHHLAYAPLLTSINSDLFASNVERGPMETWVYVMKIDTTTVSRSMSAGFLTNRTFRFKLEVLH